MTGAFRCHKCERVTTWVPMKANTRVKCVSCSMPYPCKACGHLDCKSERGDYDERIVGMKKPATPLDKQIRNIFG